MWIAVSFSSVLVFAAQTTQPTSECTHSSCGPQSHFRISCASVCPREMKVWVNRDLVFDSCAVAPFFGVTLSSTKQSLEAAPKNQFFDLNFNRSFIDPSLQVLAGMDCKNFDQRLMLSVAKTVSHSYFPNGERCDKKACELVELEKTPKLEVIRK